MTIKRVTIQKESGLHARHATEFVNQAARYSSEITIRAVGEEDGANAKSLVMLLSMGYGRGMTVEIMADGPDEKEAVETLAELVNTDV